MPLLTGKPDAKTMQEHVAALDEHELVVVVTNTWERGIEELEDIVRAVALELYPGLVSELPPPAMSPYEYPYEMLTNRVRKVLEDER